MQACMHDCCSSMIALQNAPWCLWHRVQQHTMYVSVLCYTLCVCALLLLLCSSAARQELYKGRHNAPQTLLRLLFGVHTSVTTADVSQSRMRSHISLRAYVQQLSTNTTDSYNCNCCSSCCYCLLRGVSSAAAAAAAVTTAVQRSLGPAAVQQQALREQQAAAVV
eukprot:19288-Heterococcus_DN1.PRE.1